MALCFTKVYFDTLQCLSKSGIIRCTDAILKLQMPWNQMFIPGTTNFLKSVNISWNINKELNHQSVTILLKRVVKDYTPFISLVLLLVFLSWVALWISKFTGSEIPYRCFDKENFNTRFQSNVWQILLFLLTAFLCSFNLIVIHLSNLPNMCFHSFSIISMDFVYSAFP